MLIVVVLLLGIVCVSVAAVALRQRWQAANEPTIKLGFDNPAYSEAFTPSSAASLDLDDPDGSGYMDVPASGAGMTGFGDKDAMYCEVGSTSMGEVGYMDVAPLDESMNGPASMDGSGYMDVAPLDESVNV